MSSNNISTSVKEDNAVKMLENTRYKPPWEKLLEEVKTKLVKKDENKSVK